MRQRIQDPYGRPVQQAMTVDPGDYAALNLSRPMLGIILSVNPADSVANRSAFQTGDYRGQFATATVLVVRDGRDVYLPLDNVVITPDYVSGLDSYYERLPRGCSNDIRGNALNSTPTNIWELDGDWCVVGWLGGSMDSPFILRWWPHPRNPHDPATSGRADPLHPAQSSTLDQRNRHFVRVNGVEYLVTNRGDIYLSTTRANSALSFGSDLSPEEGRFRRTLDADNGGSVKIWVKPSQIFELDFNEQEEGIGVEDLQEDQLSQTNPGGRHTSNGVKDNTFLKLSKDRAYFTVAEEIKLNSKKRILLTSQEETTLTIGQDLTLDVTGDMSVTVDGSSTASITGDLSWSTQGNCDLASDQTIDIVGENVELSSRSSTIGGTASIVVSPAGVVLGTGALGGVVGGTPLNVALAALSAAVTAAQSVVVTETPYSAAMASAIADFVLAMQAAVSATTTVG